MSDSDSDEDEETESLLFHYMDDEERRVLFQLARLEPPTKLQAMAEAGSSAAQGFLGIIHLSNENEEEAIKWLERGVSNGDLESMYTLGMVLFGQDNDTHLDRVRLLWKEAAYKGHYYAMFKYGVLLYRGKAGPTEEEKSRFFLSQAATHGVLEAGYHLATLLEFGLGGPVDTEGAAYWRAVCLSRPEVMESIANADQLQAHQLQLDRAQVQDTPTPPTEKTT